MKSVCVKHEQAFETECPWCETERVEEAAPREYVIWPLASSEPLSDAERLQIEKLRDAWLSAFRGPRPA